MFVTTFKLNFTSAARPPLVRNSTDSASFASQHPWSQRRSTLHVTGKIGNVKWTWLLDTGLILEKHSHGFVLSPVVVSLISDQVIPPHSQCFVHAVATDYGPCDQDVLFFSFMHKMARLNVLLGASVVAEDPQNRIPVTVMNNSNLPIKLFAGIRIGELSPVKVDDQSAKINTVSENPPPPPLPPKKGPVAVNWIIVKCHLQRRRNEQPSWMITAMCSPTMTQKLAALTEPTSTFIPRLRCLSL